MFLNQVFKISLSNKLIISVIRYLLEIIITIKATTKIRTVDKVLSKYSAIFTEVNSLCSTRLELEMVTSSTRPVWKTGMLTYC